MCLPFCISVWTRFLPQGAGVGVMFGRVRCILSPFFAWLYTSASMTVCTFRARWSNARTTFCHVCVRTLYSFALMGGRMQWSVRWSVGFVFAFCQYKAISGGERTWGENDWVWNRCCDRANVLKYCWMEVCADRGKTPMYM